MPSLDHDGLVHLFRNRPSLAVSLLEGIIGGPLPKGEYRVEDSNLDQVTPTEYRADLVFAVGEELRVVVEVQLGKDPAKHFAWPSYVVNLRARSRCPVLLVVVAPSPAVAKWAAQPIDLGHPRFCLEPIVIGPGSVPLIEDPELARREPELAVLSALWHENSVRAAGAALAGLSAPGRLVRAFLVLC